MIGPEISFDSELAIRRINKMWSGDIPIETAIMTVVTVAEYRIDEIIRHGVARSRENASPLALLSLKEANSNFTQSWEGRRRVLVQGFGARELAGDVGRRFHVLVIARNALAHGSGRLTDRQLGGKPAKAITLGKDMQRFLGISLRGRTLAPSGETRRLTILAGSEYVRAADLALQAYVDSLDVA